MKLETVTISGADDGVDRKELDALAEEFPFVEWGILLSRSRVGTPRYPSVENISRLASESPPGRIAFHLCGEPARQTMAGQGPEPHGAVRFQLNGFTELALGGKDRTPLASWIARCEDELCPVILQVGNLKALEVAARFAEPFDLVSALYDESGGRGEASLRWPDMPEDPELHVGYAGGLTPDNVEWYIRKLETMKPLDALTWIDMESGVRTQNRFDLTKVRSVLETARRFVHVGG